MRSLAVHRPLLLASGYLGYVGILVFGNLPGWRSGIGAYAPGAVLHSGAYGFLASLFFLALGGGPAARTRFAITTCAVMGAGDEFLQSFFPYRHASVQDWAVDVLAASIVCLLLTGAGTWQRRAS
jgi:hypothetical protein